MTNVNKPFKPSSHSKHASKSTKHKDVEPTIKDPNVRTIVDLVSEFAAKATVITDEDALSRLEANQEQDADSLEPKATKKKKVKAPKVNDQLLKLVTTKANIEASGTNLNPNVSDTNNSTNDVETSENADDLSYIFEQYMLDDVLLKNLHAQEFFVATPIQRQVLPKALEGTNLLASAATGTGKTLAYLIPTIQALFDYPSRSQECRALIVAPTRDLTLQIYELAKLLLANTRIKCNYLVGQLTNDKADNYDRDQDHLHAQEIFEQNQFVVTTPGRLANELKGKYLDLTSVEVLVVDEADRTLDIGAGEDLNIICEHTANRRQTLFFSATLNDDVTQLFNQIVTDNKDIIEDTTISNTQIDQWYYHCDSVEHKLQLLASIIKDYNLTKTIVFVKKKENVSRVCKYLMNQKMGIRATQIDGDMDKDQRARALGLFTQGKVQIIVTTDLLARGIDISNVKAVINYDIPFDGESYVHRIGRTGRMGSAGLAINLVEAHDYYNLGKAMRFTHQIITPKVYPGLEPTTSVKEDAFHKRPGAKPKTKKTKAEQKKITKKLKSKEVKAKTKVKTVVKKNKGFPKKFLEKTSAGLDKITIT